MGQTMAEKVFSRNNVGGKPVKAGDIIDARIDGIMISGLRLLDEHAKKGGLPGGLPTLWDKEKVYVITAEYQPAADARRAESNKQDREAARRLGVKHFHDAVPGIHHQMMCDFGYVRPGELILGTNSHSTLYGALNAAAAPIGEADATYATAFGELWFMVPDSVKVVLTGTLPRFPFAKDVAMYLAAKYGDDVGQYRSFEFVGSAASEMSLDSRMCLSDQAVELGAKFAFFEADQKAIDYVKARTDRAFQPVSADPDAEYERVIEVNVEDIPVMVSKPYWFKNGVPVGDVAGTRIDQAVIGSCANGRLEDFEIVARMVKGKKVAPGVRFILSPASYAVMRDCLAAGVFQDIMDAGGQIVAPGCGVCMASAGTLLAGEVSISAATRNHMGRNGSPDAMVYLGGPATVAASALAGEIVDPSEALHDIGVV